MTNPFASFINFDTGLLEQYDNKVIRRLSDMKGIFYNEQAYQESLGKEDSVIYEVYEKSVPEESGQLAHAVTVIHPGKVGDEYYMTKGHYHVVPGTAELYLAIKGQGGIIMQKESGESQYMEMKPGALVYVAPYWAHRTVNTADGDFTFLAIYPAHAGHDYGTIEDKGFRKVIVELEGLPTIGDNPKWSAE